MQEVDPSSGVYVPAAQFMQAEPPAEAEMEPAEHKVQASAEVAPEEVIIDPGSQRVHDVVPRESA